MGECEVPPMPGWLGGRVVVDPPTGVGGGQGEVMSEFGGRLVSEGRVAGEE